MCQCDQVSYHSNWIEPLTHHPLSGPPDLFSFWCETLKFPLLAFWLNCPSMAAPPALCISAAQIGIDITAANPYSNESFLPHCWPINQLFSIKYILAYLHRPTVCYEWSLYPIPGTSSHCLHQQHPSAESLLCWAKPILDFGSFYQPSAGHGTDDK